MKAIRHLDRVGGSGRRSIAVNVGANSADDFNGFMAPEQIGNGICITIVEEVDGTTGF